jgi:hypothetical protein
MIFDTSPSQSANWIRTSSALAGLAAIILIQSEANAQTVPNLVGTWKGSAQAVFLGSNPYRPNRNAGANYSPDVREFTFVIKEQNDNRFSGESTDGKRTEKLIGGISPDNKSGIVLDDDGQYVFTIRDNDTLDFCYSQCEVQSGVVLQLETSEIARCWR